MATIADAFLDDMDDSENEEVAPELEKVSESNESIEEVVEDEFVDIDAMEIENEKEIQVSEVKQVSNFLTSKILISHMKKLREFMEIDTNKINRQLEYPHIIESNSILVDIANEIRAMHKYVRDLYAPKFSELEQLVQNPIDYARVILRIGNNTELSEKCKEFDDLLQPHTVMVISMAATATTSKPLDEESSVKVFQGCNTIISLDDTRREIESYIASRLQIIAPNLSALLGPDVAASLLSFTGGINDLSKIPSNTINTIGASSKLKTTFYGSKIGIIGDCNIVANAPTNLRNKAVRLVAAKTGLAARVDAFGESPNGDQGFLFREKIEKQMEKLQEPPPPKQVKALPIPLERRTKHRGGERARRFKAKYELTDVQKQRNRVAFGTAEVEYEDSGVGFGMLGISSAIPGGKIRVANKDTQKLARLGNRKIAAKRKFAATSGISTSGLASSLAFTPIQGLELLNPLADAEKQLESGTKTYFSDTSSFLFATPLPRDPKDIKKMKK